MNENLNHIASVRLLFRFAVFALSILIIPILNATEVADAMIEEFAGNAAVPFTTEAGNATWVAKQTNGRSCESCHGESLFATGSHYKTGKLIEPMAPSVNPERLTERRKINKWFLRNCKWTYGRECTAQEKGDILLWLVQQ